MKKRRLAPQGQRTSGLLKQIAILFLLGVITTGAITFFSQHIRSDLTVTEQTEKHAAEITDEVTRAVREYPAHEWLMRYWYEHADELDVVYDAEFDSDAVTAEKCRLLAENNPGFEPRYATAAQIERLSGEDQKRCAEITYTWLITRVNQIKHTYHIDFLFCVLTDDSFQTQFFLFSAADSGAVRGTEYEEVYPLGTTVTVEQSQQAAMRRASEHSSHFADAGSYVDYYAFLDKVGNRNALIGLTYNLSALRSDVNAHTLSGTVYAVALQLFLSLVCLAVIFFFVLRPLKRVQKTIRSYQQTKDSAAVTRTLETVRPHNEIGELSQDVSALAVEMDNHVNHIREMTAENERIGTELSLAARIQTSMLPQVFPPFPECTEFDVFASMTPAKEVGGDFYDFFMVDDDHLCLVIADVSGKGVPAALFMMASKIILANNAMMGKSPAQILTDTNAAICANNREQMFVTAWLGILELSTGRLTAANAGHENPIIKAGNGVFEVYKDCHGFVIGGLDGIKYREYELQLTPGAKLFVYTDGVSEAADGDKRLFGTERTLNALNRSPDAPPRELLLNVKSAVDGFVGAAEQFDDMTMLCVEYKGKDSA